MEQKRVALKLKQACEETAAQAIAATITSGQASRIHGKNQKFGSWKEAMAAKIAAAKAKREAKEAADNARWITSADKSCSYIIGRSTRELDEQEKPSIRELLKKFEPDQQVGLPTTSTPRFMGVDL